MDLIVALVLAHFVCDYAFQTEFMAVGKGSFSKPHFGVPWYYPMAAHCATHAAAVQLLTGSWILAVIQFWIHFFVDFCKAKNWINIHVDQTIHVVIKVVIALITLKYGVI